VRRVTLYAGYNPTAQLITRSGTAIDMDTRLRVGRAIGKDESDVTINTKLGDTDFAKQDLI
jgi:hypothetical protein